MNHINQNRLTVFTPSYNRAHTLGRCYESLKRQSRKDFTWLIIDDGSTDDTCSLVMKWKKQEKDFEIRYVYKENGGVHTAFNTAYRLIGTELCVCVGSDDYLTDRAVELILRLWEKEGGERYAGIIALNSDCNHSIIGTSLPEQGELRLSEYYDKGGSGDKKLIYRTEVVNSYPEYPVFEGENFFAVGYKFMLIDQDYSLLVLNQPICIVEYSTDGYTKNMSLLRVRNPKGFAFRKRMDLIYEKRVKFRLIKAAQYVAYSLISHNRHFLRESPRKLSTLCMLPLGLCYSLLLRCQARQKNRER